MCIHTSIRPSTHTYIYTLSFPSHLLMQDVSSRAVHPSVPNLLYTLRNYGNAVRRNIRLLLFSSTIKTILRSITRFLRLWCYRKRMKSSAIYSRSTTSSPSKSNLIFDTLGKKFYACPCMWLIFKHVHMWSIFIYGHMWFNFISGYVDQFSHMAINGLIRTYSTSTGHISPY